MLRRAHIAVLGLAGLASAAGISCTLLTSLDGLSGGVGEGGVAESGSDAPTTPPPSDATTEAAADAASDSPVAPGAFCASASGDFCADFDTGQRDVGWTATDIRGVGTFELDTGKSKSAPASLHATFPRADVGSDKFQQLVKKWPGAARASTIDLDVFLEPIAWQQNDKSFTIAELYFDEPEKMGVLVALTDGPWRLSIRTPTVMDVPAPAPFPTGAWTHLRVVADPKTSGGSVKAYLDNQLVIDETGLSFTQDPTEMQFWIGLGGASTPIPAADVRLDNVLVKFN